MSRLVHALSPAGHEPFSGSELLDAVSEAFPGVYSKDVGVSQGYSLYEHTLMVLGQYEKYFSSSPLPAGLEHSHFRLFLSVHDLGKPLAVEEGNRHRQAIHNPILFDEHFPKHPIISDRHRSILWSLLHGDPVGRHIKRGGTQRKRVLQELEDMYGQTTDLSKSEYMDILLIYYMSDAGSYTRDAGPKPGLDHLFEFKDNEMRFSSATEQLVQSLTDGFLNH